MLKRIWKWFKQARCSHWRTATKTVWDSKRQEMRQSTVCLLCEKSVPIRKTAQELRDEQMLFESLVRNCTVRQAGADDTREGS